MDELLIIDGNNLSLRAMHAAPRLYARNLVPTGCLFTSIRMLCKIGDLLRPRRTVVVWDGGHARFRKALYPEYKARPALEEDDPQVQFLDEWRQQTAALRVGLPLLGVGQVLLQKTEADDVIAALVDQASASGWRSVIASSDQDFMQLLGPDCDLYQLSKDRRFTVADLHAEHGLTPEQWVDLRALTGDSSDNIPGVKGVGPKRAAELLRAHGSVDAFVHRPQDPKQKVRVWEAAIMADLPVIRRNRALMNLRAIITTGAVDLETLELQFLGAMQTAPDHTAFWQFCQQYEMATLLQESALWQFLYRE